MKQTATQIIRRAAALLRNEGAGPAQREYLAKQLDQVANEVGELIDTAEGCCGSSRDLAELRDALQLVGARMTQNLRQQHALTAYNIVQATKRHDMRAAEAAARQRQPYLSPVPTSPAPKRSAFVRILDRVVAFCDWFVDNGWVLLVGIVLAAAIFGARANGVIE